METSKPQMDSLEEKLNKMLDEVFMINNKVYPTSRVDTGTEEEEDEWFSLSNADNHDDRAVTIDSVFEESGHRSTSCMWDDNQEGQLRRLVEHQVHRERRNQERKMKILEDVETEKGDLEELVFIADSFRKKFEELDKVRRAKRAESEADNRESRDRRREAEDLNREGSRENPAGEDINQNTIEIHLDMKNLGKRLQKHNKKIMGNLEEAESSNMTPSVESQKTVNEIRRHHEDIMKEYEDLEKRVIKSKSTKEIDEVFQDLKLSLETAEENSEKLEIIATPLISTREVDIKSFKITQVVPLSLQVYHQGSSFSEWIAQIHKLWNSNPVSEEIILDKALDSMDKYEKQLAMQLRSQNFKSFERLESQLYLYGTPQILTNLLQRHHKNVGKVPHFLTPENALEARTTIQRHLSGMKSSSALLSYLEEKLGKEKAERKMEQGPMSSLVLDEIIAGLPNLEFRKAVRTIESLSQVESFNYVRGVLNHLLEDLHMIIVRYGTRDIVAGAVANGNDEVGNPLSKENRRLSSEILEIERTLAKEKQRVSKLNEQLDLLHTVHKNTPPPGMSFSVPREKYNWNNASHFEIGTFNINDPGFKSFASGGSNPNHMNGATQSNNGPIQPGMGIRETGIIERLLHSYGFIQCCDRQAGLFFHFSQFNGNIEHLRIGDPVEFEMTYDRRTDKPVANAVSKIASEVVETSGEIQALKEEFNRMKKQAKAFQKQQMEKEVNFLKRMMPILAQNMKRNFNDNVESHSATKPDDDYTEQVSVKDDPSTDKTMEGRAYNKKNGLSNLFMLSLMILIFINSQVKAFKLHNLNFEENYPDKGGSVFDENKPEVVIPAMDVETKEATSAIVKGDCMTVNNEAFINEKGHDIEIPPVCMTNTWNIVSTKNILEDEDPTDQKPNSVVQSDKPIAIVGNEVDLVADTNPMPEDEVVITGVISGHVPTDNRIVEMDAGNHRTLEIQGGSSIVGCGDAPFTHKFDLILHGNHLTEDQPMYDAPNCWSDNYDPRYTLAFKNSGDHEDADVIFRHINSGILDSMESYIDIKRADEPIFTNNVMAGCAQAGLITRGSPCDKKYTQEDLYVTIKMLLPVTSATTKKVEDKPTSHSIEKPIKALPSPFLTQVPIQLEVLTPIVGRVSRGQKYICKV